ncbi:MAG: tetratricopeptide repeat protein, partial [Proteobacteria bacterium]|nr:tetratricopeptide repeat protein [Pseudomonadota bacterium]
MYYPTLQHVKAIIRRINSAHNAKIVITNSGQLEFALAKPKMSIYGGEQYHKMYQKAATLMETITKAHALSDGNKRVAMMVAQTMVEINGGRLVLPLKSIRLSVDTAMDAEGAMPEIIQQWFKVHIATDAYSLCSMLAELDEEEGIIRSMLEQGREADANSLLDRWMVFDNYPEHRRACGDLINSWKKTQEASDASRAANRDAGGWRPAWTKFMATRDLPHASYDPPYDYGGDSDGLHYNHNSMAELRDAEERVRKESARYRESTDAPLVLQNALRLERHGMYDDAVGVFERLRGIGPDESRAAFHMALIMQYRMGDFESALKYWSVYLKYRPDEPAGNLQTGLTLMELKRYSDALDHLEKIPDEYPNIDIYKGEVYARMGKHDRAIEFYRKALSANQYSVDAHGLMGISYASIGDLEHALECFDKVVEIQPDYRGYYNRGTILADLSRYDEAINSYKMALAENPNHLESRINLASETSNAGRPEEAMPHFLSALDVDPGH